MTDFIEEMQTEAQLRFGKELSPAEVATEFAKHGFEARIHHLKNLKDADPDTAEPFATPRDAARRDVYRRALINTHNHLRALQR